MVPFVWIRHAPLQSQGRAHVVRTGPHAERVSMPACGVAAQPVTFQQPPILGLDAANVVALPSPPAGDTPGDITHVWWACPVQWLAPKGGPGPGRGGGGPGGGWGGWGGWGGGGGPGCGGGGFGGAGGKLGQGGNGGSAGGGHRGQQSCRPALSTIACAAGGHAVMYWPLGGTSSWQCPLGLPGKPSSRSPLVSLHLQGGK